MKKLVALIALVCILFTCAVGWGKKADAPAELPSQTADGAPDAEKAPEIDYDRLYATHAPDDVVISVNGAEVVWDEYFNWVKSSGKQIEDYFDQMQAYYGMPGDWNVSIGDDLGTTYGEYPARYAEDTLRNELVVKALADSKGIDISEEDRAQLTDEALATAILGADATVDELKTELESIYMSIDSYRHLVEASILRSEIASALYGESGEKLPAEDVIDYLEESGYISAHHILIMTIDPGTSAELDEAQVAEKKALADSIYAELAAIEDRDERFRRFEELKNEYCEDGGKTSYPHGYTFTPGTMVSVFEDACNSLGEYEVSEPVQSAYGYHIIMRLPLAADSLLYSAGGAPSTATSDYASVAFRKELEQFEETLEIVLAPELETLTLADYVK